MLRDVIAMFGILAAIEIPIACASPEIESSAPHEVIEGITLSTDGVPIAYTATGRGDERCR